MKVISPKVLAGTMLRISRRIMALLGARKGTQKFAAPMKVAHNGVKTAQSAFVDAQDAAIDADAIVSAVLFDSHEEVTDLELDLFSEVRKDRDAPRYQLFFSTSMTDVKTKNAVDFHVWLGDTAVRLKALPATDALRKKHEKLVDGLLVEWKKPLADQHAADLVEEAAALKLATAQAAWSNAYVALHGALQNAFPARKAFVESFFASDRKSSTKAAPNPPGEKPAPEGQKTAKVAKAAKKVRGP